ncbi:Bacterial flagellin N-terminus domain protein [Verrucomicrobia bacterium]|nr:Bacterial flagellin N-terminus domain protein [Verrucomicrobiota bacterium]
MVINTNIMAESAANYLQQSSAALSQAVAELSSGSKIVHPSDDPAGLAISMQYDAQTSELGAAAQNVANAQSYSQTQDGFLQEVSSALDRMATLATQAQDATETGTDLSAYQAEYNQLSSYITDVGSKNFNGVSMFSGATPNVTIDAGGDTWGMGGVNLGAAAYTPLKTEDLTTAAGAKTALTDINTAITQLATDRATVGANEARLNYTSNQLSVEQTNVDAANSAIKDVNVATESTQYSKLQILVQSGTAMLAQANSIPQSVLKLITG